MHQDYRFHPTIVLGPSCEGSETQANGIGPEIEPEEDSFYRELERAAAECRDEQVRQEALRQAFNRPVMFDTTPVYSIYDDFNPGPVDPDFCEKVEERMNEYGMHRPVCGIGPEIEPEEESAYTDPVYNHQFVEACAALARAKAYLEDEGYIYPTQDGTPEYILGDVVYPTKEAYDKACDEFSEWVCSKRRLLEEEDFDNLFNGGNCRYTLPLDEYDYPADCSDPCSVPHESIAVDLLREAADVIEQRGRLRDKPCGERSMARAVAIYQVAKGNTLDDELSGWLFMICLKIARATAGASHLDDYTDIAGYAALAGECIVNNNKEVE